MHSQKFLNRLHFRFLYRELGVTAVTAVSYNPGVYPYFLTPTFTLFSRYVPLRRYTYCRCQTRLGLPPMSFNSVFHPACVNAAVNRLVSTFIM